MARTVLVVDDEPKIRRVLRAYLEAEHYEVLEADNGLTALDLTPQADLVLLDIGLPDLDGLEVLRRVRAVSQVAVILVTARAEEVDTLVGLAVGADDYITKPFGPREVMARVKTVLRRTADLGDAGPSAGGASRDLPGSGPEPLSPPLRFEGLSVDLERREVATGAGEIDLSALEFDLLATMAQAPGRVFTRAALLEAVWGYDFYGDQRVVDVHIRNLRKALGDDAAAPRLIGTVRGVGYKFLARPEGVGAARGWGRP
ncbi:MAG: response regulator transcription factor [Austwickia sp.]|nr:response regulator transcription factor [Austwickia sp.]MBK8437509.1 response regulator transcription factor [Austwickia sp.]MBK9102775.1 response regulator transcription factor [Austwickia sp.]